MIRWLSPSFVMLMHRELTREHGGPQGIRDLGVLESAVARPKNLHAYEKVQDLHRLAAAYGYGISRNHPFVDGNKRVSLMVMYVFLKMNGIELAASEEDAYVTIRDLASGDLSEEALEDWLQQNSR
jgi:death on curing protein